MYKKLTCPKRITRSKQVTPSTQASGENTTNADVAAMENFQKREIKYTSLFPNHTNEQAHPFRRLKELFKPAGMSR